MLEVGDGRIISKPDDKLWGLGEQGGSLDFSDSCPLTHIGSPTKSYPGTLSVSYSSASHFLPLRSLSLGDKSLCPEVPEDCPVLPHAPWKMPTSPEAPSGLWLGMPVWNLFPLFPHLSPGNMDHRVSMCSSQGQLPLFNSQL